MEQPHLDLTRPATTTMLSAPSLFNNISGSGNNAFGNSALLENMVGVDNTAIGDLALLNNDSDGTGTANFNTAVGSGALSANVDGGETPPWGSTRSRTTTRTSSPPLVLMRYLPTPPAPAIQPSAVARSLSTRRAVVTLPWAWMLVATSLRPITSFVSVPLVTMWKIAALLAISSARHLRMELPSSLIQTA